MNLPKLLALGLLVAIPSARAVYAPIPEKDQGEALVFSARASITHDDNIFGAQASEVESTIFSVSPKVTLNTSLDPKTFLSAHYQLTVDHFTDRPGSKTLDSHQLMARLSHQFREGMTIDLTDAYTIQHNPESLLAGLPLNSDQSSKNNQLDLVFNLPIDPKLSLTAKARSMLYRFNSARLSGNLDRAENLYGLSGNYKMQPELTLNAEYRYQTIDYRFAGATKDKRSHFFLAGGEYMVAEQVYVTARGGVENRARSGETDTTTPYLELTGKFDYAEGSFFSGGFVYTLEEASNVTTYTDTKARRFFVNLQHAITPLITASGAVNYEPSKLRGRTGIASVDETTWRFGFALTYAPGDNLTLSATYDRDDVTSDDRSREMLRNRFGAVAAYSF